MSSSAQPGEVGGVDSRETPSSSSCSAARRRITGRGAPRYQAFGDKTAKGQDGGERQCPCPAPPPAATRRTSRQSPTLRSTPAEPASEAYRERMSVPPDDRTARPLPAISALNARGRSDASYQGSPARDRACLRLRPGSASSTRRRASCFGSQPVAGDPRLRSQPRTLVRKSQGSGGGTRWRRLLRTVRAVTCAAGEVLAASLGGGLAPAANKRCVCVAGVTPPLPGAGAPVGCLRIPNLSSAMFSMPLPAGGPRRLYSLRHAHRRPHKSRHNLLANALHEPTAS